ncbi:ABC transporter permease [Clostridium sp. MSJ-11]|uniref:ABC transporter permease n=1 Tax=Clostridium mobile TaxID=2841512 RepID=A0ABS6EHP0_9CLOT|nr:ABC transporter permease [Clostridium mobile]MBU5484726.1 ABC transporter permease [Clostridium mobile]
MKLKAYIKITLKGIIKELPMMLFVFAVFPIFLSCLYGYFQKDVFNISNEMSKVTISIVDEDNSNASKGLIDFLQGEELKKIIKVEEEDKSDMNVKIPLGYEESLLNLKENEIKIDQKDKKKLSSFKIVTILIDKYNQDIQQGVVIKNKLGEEKLKDINSKISELYEENVIENNIIKTENNLTSFEYYSVSIMSFIIIYTIISLVAGYYTERENGVFNRIMSTSLSKVQYFNYNLVTFFMFAMIMNFIYVMTYRVFNISFKGSLGLLMVLLTLTSILEAVVAGLVIAFIKSKKTATHLLNGLVIVSCFFGGVFLPIDKMNNSFMSFIGKFMPNRLIIKSYNNYLLNNSLNDLYPYIFMFAASAAVLYIVSLLKVKLKWGEE